MPARLTLAPLVSLLALFAAIEGAACFAATTPSPASSATDSGADGAALDTAAPPTAGSSSGCLVMTPAPATVTVLGPDGGAIACDATLSIVEDGGTLLTYCSPAALPHPGSLPNACALLEVNEGGVPCAYSIYPLNTDYDETGPFTFAVTQPGYRPAIVQDVYPTLSAPCEFPPPASQSTVLLQPLPDAGDGWDAF